MRPTWGLLGHWVLSLLHTFFSIFTSQLWSIRVWISIYYYLVYLSFVTFMLLRIFWCLLIKYNYLHVLPPFPYSLTGIENTATLVIYNRLTTETSDLFIPKTCIWNQWLYKFYFISWRFSDFLFCTFCIRFIFSVSCFLWYIPVSMSFVFYSMSSSYFSKLTLLFTFKWF